VTDVVLGAFEQMELNYEGSNKRKATLMRRLELFNTNINDRSDKGFIKLRPAVDERIKRSKKQ